PQRLEDVHHERGRGGLVRHLRLDRPRGGTSRPVGVRGPGRLERRGRGGGPRQAPPARGRHHPPCLPGRSGARRGPGRGGGAGGEGGGGGGGRVEDGDGGGRLHEARDGGRRGRSGARGFRARRRVRKDAGPVRPADRDQPGGQLLSRRHGRGDRGGASVDLAG